MKEVELSNEDRKWKKYNLYKMDSVDILLIQYLRRSLLIKLKNCKHSWGMYILDKRNIKCKVKDMCLGGEFEEEQRC